MLLASVSRWNRNSESPGCSKRPTCLKSRSWRLAGCSRTSRLSTRSRRRAPASRHPGSLYSASPQVRAEIEAARGRLDRFELLMPVSERRKPFARPEKRRVVLETLAYARDRAPNVGVGFPQSTQASPEFLLEISQECAEQGAARIIVYDTNGGSDPFATVRTSIRRMKAHLGVPVFFHGHNDLGLAAANAFAAARAGADGLDVTVNGLGDRAGNASLEQVAMILHLRGVRTGICLGALTRLSGGRRRGERHRGAGTRARGGRVRRHAQSAGPPGSSRAVRSLRPALLSALRRTIDG